MIGMSARIDHEDERLLRDLGVRAVVSKPFARTDLAGALGLLDRVPGFATGACGHRTFIAARPVGKAVRVPECSRHMTTRGCARGVLGSRDTTGSGHSRRKTVIARTREESNLKANVLLVPGVREAGWLELPPGIDCPVSSSSATSAEGAYPSPHFDLETCAFIRLRAYAFNASVSACGPDRMVVGQVPGGAPDSRDPVLTTLTAGGESGGVHGLRSALDEPGMVRREWERRGNPWAIEQHHDDGWIYGEPATHDLCREYPFGPGFTARARFTGYRDACTRVTPRTGSIEAPGRAALCGNVAFRRPRRVPDVRLVDLAVVRREPGASIHRLSGAGSPEGLCQDAA